MPATALFDLDGTLADTVAVDDECYIAALAECFGFPEAAECYDWHAAEHVSDLGILEHLFRVHRQRAPTAREVTRFQQRFLARTRAMAETAPERFDAIAGAAELLEALVSQGWRVAIATGGLEETARLKLVVAGFPPDLIHGLASGSDAISRCDIARLAAERAGGGTGGVLIGDGLWDLEAARQLGCGFLGRAEGARAAALRAAGAVHVVADFRRTDHVIDILRTSAGR